MSWESLLPDILPYVAGPDETLKRPPDGLILHTLRRAAEQFLRESTLLRDMSHADLQCGVREVPLILPPGRTLVRITRVGPRDGHSTCTCRPDGSVGYAHAGDGILMLDEAPMWDARRGLVIQYAYTVDLATCAAPDWVSDTRWRDAVVAITLQRLWAMAGMDWGNPSMAADQQRVADNLLARARQFAANQGGRPQRTRVSRKLGDMFWGI